MVFNNLSSTRLAEHAEKDWSIRGLNADPNLLVRNQGALLNCGGEGRVKLIHA